MARSLYIDIAALLRGGLTPPEPDILSFSEEDFCLFYSGEFNLIFGDTESGKTWLCLAAVASVLDEGGRATIADLDHNGADSLIGNLIKLGVHANTLEDRTRFRLSEPGDRLDVKELVQDQLAFRPDIVVIDSLGELIPLFSGNSNGADDFTVVHSEVIRPLTKVGVAVLVVDHLAKNADSRAMGRLHIPRVPFVLQTCDELRVRYPWYTPESIWPRVRAPPAPPIRPVSNRGQRQRRADFPRVSPP